MPSEATSRRLVVGVKRAEIVAAGTRKNNPKQLQKKMLTTTMSDFSKDVIRYLNNVADNDETLIINRGNDNGVVILSLDEYNSLCATHHELSSKINEQRLDSAIAKLRSGSSFQKNLIEE